MRIRREDFKGFLDNDWYYYCAKVTSGTSFEAHFIEQQMELRYVSDINILKAVRDFCPLEYLDYYDNKYFRYLYSAILLNVLYNQESFTKDFCIIDIPKDTFSIEEADMLTNVLRRCGIDFGLVVRKLGTHNLTSEWKKQYILNEYYDGTKEQWISFKNKFAKKDEDDYKKRKYIKKEIEEKLITLIRYQLLNGSVVITGNNIGEKNYEVSELVARLLHKFDDSPKMNLLVAEIYYRYGLPKQADKLLGGALKLDGIDNDTVKEIKRLQQLVRNKKFKGKLRNIEELSGKYFEDITGEHMPVLEEGCLKDMEYEG